MVQIMHCYWMLMTMKKGSGGGYSGYSDIDGSSQSFSPVLSAPSCDHDHDDNDNYNNYE